MKYNIHINQSNTKGSIGTNDKTVFNLMAQIVATTERMNPEEYKNYIAAIRVQYEAKLKNLGIQP